MSNSEKKENKPTETKKEDKPTEEKKETFDEALKRLEHVYVEKAAKLNESKDKYLAAQQEVFVALQQFSSTKEQYLVTLLRQQSEELKRSKMELENSKLELEKNKVSAPMLPTVPEETEQRENNLE